LSAEEFNRTMRAESSTVDGDVALTPLGEDQANRLAEVWAPILKPKAQAGKLHVFVSPMKRALQTADPLLRALNVTSVVQAIVKPSIMEFGGLTAPSDMGIFDETDKLRKAGDMQAVKDLLRTFRWKACGFSGQRLLEAFPWAQVLEDFPMDAPWWSQGFEGPKRTDARVAGVLDEIRDFPSKFGEGDIVVFVTHGGTIGDLMYRLLLRQDPATSKDVALLQPNFETSDNTSVTSLLLPGKKFPFERSLRGPDRPSEFGCRVEFANNTVHLGVPRLQDWAKRSGVIPSNAKL